MRTTLALDDDILAAARSLAERQGKSLGEVVSSLVRQGLQGTVSGKPATLRNGIPLLRSGRKASPVTMELVNQLRDELP